MEPTPSGSRDRADYRVVSNNSTIVDDRSSNQWFRAKRGTVYFIR